MRNRFLIFGLTCVFLALIAFTLSENFEIHTIKKQTGFSAEALRNPYLALERWLAGTGRPVRVLRGGSRADFSSVEEGVVCLSAVSIEWHTEETGRMLAWVEAGGHLFLYLTGAAARAPETDGAEKYNRLESFLAALGIERVYGIPVFAGSDDYITEIGGGLAFNPAGENPSGDTTFLRDARGYARLVTVRKALGSITVCGSPLFMRTDALRGKANASLAWQMTGARDPDKKGILFIRGKEDRDSLYGELAGRGNMAFVCAAALIVVITGFWMVIPVFGRLRADIPRPGRPIRERFLAEGRFLKKFRGLEKYLDAYIHEIRLRAGILPDEELSAPELAARCGLPPRDVKEALTPGKKIHFSKFLRRRKILETLLERL